MSHKPSHPYRPRATPQNLALVSKPAQKNPPDLAAAATPKPPPTIVKNRRETSHRSSINLTQPRQTCLTKPSGIRARVATERALVVGKEETKCFEDLATIQRWGTGMGQRGEFENG